jgi:hypothetical protein
MFGQFFAGKRKQIILHFLMRKTFILIFAGFALAACAKQSQDQNYDSTSSTSTTTTGSSSQYTTPSTTGGATTNGAGNTGAAATTTPNGTSADTTHTMDTTHRY